MTAIPPRHRRGARGPSLAPTLDDLVDGAFLAALGTLDLIGLRTTYGGHQYLVTGLFALLIGMVVAHLGRLRRLPVVVTLAALVVAYFVFGGVLVLRDEAVGGVLPGGSVLGDLATGIIHVWRQLLTTLPPVATDGPLLLVPYVIGLFVGNVGYLLARRWRAAAGPVPAAVVGLAAVILLGTDRSAARIWQGVVFAVVALGWTMLRARRAGRRAARSIRPGGVTSTTKPARAAVHTRTALALTVIAVGAGGAWLAGPHLPGSGGNRVVLRSYVHVPFDLGAYASPLVGFRKYTKDANVLYDQTLFTVSGLPANAPIQIATLDSYNGSVWAATNGTVAAGSGQPLDAFQRVGPSIDSGAHGRSVKYTVRIGAAYASASDASAWVPTAGMATSLTFTGANASTYDSQFRYNLATGSGLVAGGLGPGATYTAQAVLDDPDLPDHAAPFAAPSLPRSADAFVSARADEWSAKVSGVVPQVQAVADYLRENGAYSDGGPGQGQYLPGHSTGRLVAFLNSPEPVGDDEQYAATFALMANYLGLPARVKLQAVPEPGGVVKGKDVHAVVQVHVVGDRAGGDWVTIPESTFMPKQSKQPDKQPPQTIQNANAAVVPPPNPVRPPSTLDQTEQPELNTHHAAPTAPTHSGGWTVPHWVWVALEAVGLPLLVIVAACAALVTFKEHRRRRRRTTGSASRRFANGWHDLIDYARDLGMSITPGRTRSEQANQIVTSAVLTEAADTGSVAALAAAADAGTFARGLPAEEAAAAYWKQIDAARHRLAAGVGRGTRIRAALTLRSFFAESGSRRPSVRRRREAGTA